MERNIVIRLATREDVSAMVSIHLAGFPGFFLTFLGPRFLNVLYENILAIEENISLVAVNDNQQIEGFVVGSLSAEGLYKKLLVNSWFDFAMASVVPAIRNPASIPRLLRALRASPNGRKSSADCLLMSIAVSPNTHGAGSGRMLIEEFLDISVQRGAQGVILTTDKENNERVNRFYNSIGFELYQSFVTPEGRQMNEYIYNLAD